MAPPPTRYQQPYTVSDVMPAPRSPRRGWIVPALIALVVLLAVALAGTAYLLTDRSPHTTPGRPAAATFTVVGTVTLNSGSANLDDKHCTGIEGFDDLRTGAQVVVTSSDGKTVGIGQLGEGLINGSGFFSTCGWAFTVVNVPAGLGFYGIEVSHRGRLQYSEAQMRQLLALTIG